MRGLLVLVSFAGICLSVPTSGEAQDVYSFGTIEAPAEEKRIVAPDSVMGLMKATLRNLVAAQEGYWLEHGSFTTDVSALGMHVRGAERRDSATVWVLFAGGRGWSAVATHSALPKKSCVIFVGDAADLPRLPRTAGKGKKAEQEGTPMCDPL